MKKKIASLLTVICLCLVLTNTAFAQSNSTVEATTAEFINSEGNTSYYLEGDRLLKVVTDAPEAVSMCSAMQSPDGTLTTSAEIDIKFYESDPLTEEEIALLRAGELTASNEATNPMGNVRANLSVKYSYPYMNKPALLRLISATSSYTMLISGEGVVPQTSSLYWNAEGDIYTNGSFTKRGVIGNTINYSTPTFSNVAIMPSNQTIDPIVAGVEYTLNCTRGITIYVRIPFAL